MTVQVFFEVHTECSKISGLLCKSLVIINGSVKLGTQSFGIKYQQQQNYSKGLFFESMC